MKTHGIAKKMYAIGHTLEYGDEEDIYDILDELIEGDDFDMFLVREALGIIYNSLVEKKQIVWQVHKQKTVTLE